MITERFRHYIRSTKRTGRFETLTMDFLLVILVSWLSTSVTGESPVCNIMELRSDSKWQVDWTQQESYNLSLNQPFAEPGVLAPGVTVSDLLNFTGMVWYIDSFIKINGLVCVRYGPFLNSIEENDEVRRECDGIVASLRDDKRKDMLLEECIVLWDMLDTDVLGQGLIETDDSCLGDSGNQDLPDSSGITCSIQPFLTFYADDIVERLSPILFEALSWLGPSPFSGDVFGVCSALRFLLSEDIDDIVNEATNILSYPTADALEYFAHVDACKDLDSDVKHILDLISASTGPNRDGLCEFVSSEPSRDDYLQKAFDIIDTILSVPVEESLCEDILAVVVKYDTTGQLYNSTGSDLTVQSARETFCEQIASSLSEDSQYKPDVYSPPEGQQLNIGSFFNQPGELLPGFSFMDMVDLMGAFFRSKTLRQGVTVICNVFENSLIQVDENLNHLCDYLEANVLASLESMCLNETVPLQYPGRPVSYRIVTPMYAIVTGVDAARKLLGLTKISKDEVCRAVDDFFYSDNSPHSVVQLFLESYLAELLPISDKICQDYENVIDYVKSTSNQSSVDFDQLVRDLSGLISTHLGFSDKEELCSAIAKGIDPASGRASNELISKMATEFVHFMEDSTRCAVVMEKTESLLMAHVGYTSEMLHSFTGYADSASLCEDMSTAFQAGKPCAASEASVAAQCYGLVVMALITLTHAVLFD